MRISIYYYDLWQHCTVLKHKKNEIKTTISNQSARTIKEFTDWNLQIGDGGIDLNENGEGNICITLDLLIQESETPLLFFLVNFVYPGLLRISWIVCDGAITIDFIKQVNDFILSLIHSEEQTNLFKFKHSLPIWWKSKNSWWVFYFRVSQRY